ncbi:hypothetical protein [Sphingobacterium cellulitidis]|uniref:hypothetical protein n=1 Tax=Sphingobacterium cellulitidis TaxID=1768011 RepID=UPI0011403BE0
MHTSALTWIDSRVRDYFAPWMDITPAGIPILKAMEGATEPHMARQHFLFHTAIDALCFCHLHPRLLARPGSNVFTVIGLKPTAGQLLALGDRYPNARTVGVFDDDLYGRVLDCRVALWLMRRDTVFRLDDGQVTFSHRDSTVRIPVPEFSLHRFRVLTGFRSTYRTVKPKGAVSFAALLAHRETEPPN